LWRTGEIATAAAAAETSFSSSPDFQYKGLRTNPPDTIYRGVSRGNCSSLHRKAWLESADPKHRYGKNLRLYYRYWESLGCPGDAFFDWLDGRGAATEEGPGVLPELEECPRLVLDADRVTYLADMKITIQYALSVVPDELGRGIVRDADGEIVRTGPDGWIFVLRDDVLYGTRKTIASADGTGSITRRFHHSSFFGGKAVASAGILVTDDRGVLTRAFPHSGHYRPGEAEVQRMLYYFHASGVDLRTFEVDVQQIIHLDRHGLQNTAAMHKRRKRDALHLRPAILVADYLCHKARLIGEGVFSQIHRINKAGALSVEETLKLITSDDDEDAGNHRSDETYVGRLGAQ
jgi:hypothetical protein